MSQEIRVARRALPLYRKKGRGRYVPRPTNPTPIYDRRELRAVVEGRALQADLDAAGGYMLSGLLMNEIIEQERSVSIVRSLARVLDPLPEGVDEIGVPSEEAAMADAEWVSELTTGSLDSTVSFGRRSLYPHPISKRIKVSRKLLRAQPFADRWITEALGAAVATPQETAFIQGSGTGEPQGILNADSLSEYETSASGQVNGDDIRKWLFSLPARFQPRAAILTSVDFMRHVLALKDANGNYLFPDYQGRLLDKRVHLTDGMPDVVDGSDALVAGAYAAIVGDFRWYWIQDGHGADLLPLGELYAEENEVGYQIWQDTDAMAVLSSAFYALKIKA